MRSLAIFALGSIVASTGLMAQSLTEHAAAGAGATVGTAAGKPLGTALGKIFGSMDQSTSKAAGPTKVVKPAELKPEAKSSAPAQSAPPLVGALPASGGAPSGGSSGGVVSSSRSSRHREMPAPEFATPFAPIAPAIPEPVIKEPSVEDIAAVKVGATSNEVAAALGAPESRVSIPDDDGRLLEICQYWSKGQQLGTVRMENGRRSKRTNPGQLGSPATIGQSLAYTESVRVLPAFLLLGTVRCLLAASAAEVGNRVEHIALDVDECYRVLDLNFAKEDLKVYLGSGYLMFAKPIDGVHLGAIFVAGADGGDADLLLMPPTRSERASMAKFTNSPTLEEHFKAAAFIFTDGTGDQLLAQLKNPEAPAKKSPDMGGLIVERWTSVLANLVASFETRVVYDILSGQPENGLFYMTVSGEHLGNFDILYDPTGRDQILAGKLGYRDNRTYFDTWTSFQARSFRNGAPLRGAHFSLSDVRIEATIAPDLAMQAVTRATLKPDTARARSVVPFSLTPSMKITSASVDGQPVEVFDRESMRSDLISNREDRQFLLVSETALDPAMPHEIEIHHEGAVIRNAGNDVYYVGSRGTWYPRTGAELAQYDLTFRYPKLLTVAATGTVSDDRTEGDWRTTHLKTDTPVRFAGFNLGNFQSAMIERNGYKINLYGNRRLESALAPRVQPPPTPMQPEDEFPRRRHNSSTPLNLAPLVAPVDPTPRIETLTRNVIATIDFMTEQFGPTPFRSLAITPIPGGFGQGFPGLVYLSTLAYLDPGQMPPQPAGARRRDLLFRPAGSA